jgi:hypothetical protein
MSDLTAIDVLINPDEVTIERARGQRADAQEHARGWVLDDTHQPHITTLQRYVRTADLEQVYDAVEKTVADTDMATLCWGVPSSVRRVYGHAPSTVGLPTRRSETSSSRRDREL